MSRVPRSMPRPVVYCAHIPSEAAPTCRRRGQRYVHSRAAIVGSTLQLGIKSEYTPMSEREIIVEEAGLVTASCGAEWGALQFPNKCYPQACHALRCGAALLRELGIFQEGRTVCSETNLKFSEVIIETTTDALITSDFIFDGQVVATGEVAASTLYVAYAALRGTKYPSEIVDVTLMGNPPKPLVDPGPPAFWPDTI